MAETTFTIDINSIKSEAKLTLSTVGKRAVGKDGSTLFASVTLSSAEEKILDQYTKSGIQVFLGELSPIVTGYTEGDQTVIRWEATRVNDGMTSAFEKNLRSFVVAYVKNEALGVSLSAEAQKNADADMQRHLQAAINLVYAKTAPTVSSAKYEDVKGSCEINDNETKIGY